MSERKRTARFAFVIMLCGAAPAARAADSAPIADAVERREDAAVLQLLRNHADVNAPQADGATALHWAAHWGDAETATRLIAAGANVNVVNELGVSPLHLACASGNVPLVTLLLKNGARTDVRRESGETPLMVAARTGNLDIVRSLTEAKADVNGADSLRGQTALMWAANEHHAEVVRFLVAHGADPNQKSHGGFTALMFAGRVGDAAVTKVLLDAGARLEDSAPAGGTALLLAAEGEAAIVAKDFKRTSYASGHEDTAILLVERGANPNAVDEFGHTALHLAVRKEKHRLIGALIAHHADLNARMTRDELPLPGDFNARDGLVGATPFFLAAAASDIDAMKILADAGADPKMPGMLGVTPLMAAVGAHQYESRLPPQKQQIEAITLCMSLGNDINAGDTGGQTAVHYAVQMGVDEVLVFLIEHGAKPDAKDRRGRTPMDVAVSNPSRPRPQSAAILHRYLDAPPAPVR